MSRRVTRSSAAASNSKNKGSGTEDKGKALGTSSSSFATPGKSLAPTSKPAEGNSPVYFWREYGSQNCYLSQWYASPFHTGEPTGIVFETAEQYMMYQKALLFNDHPIAAKILATSSPKAQKGLGRKVSNFKDTVWNLNRSRIVEEASYFKFKYGADLGELSTEDGSGISLKQRLLQTDDKELVEASPMDKIWGIGFSESNAEANRPKWGLNLLGKALMVARDRLRAEKEEDLKG